MEIHNVMEELVASIVEQIATEDADSDSPRFCDSTECRTDAICYVLNRVTPRYITSSRGVAHITEDLKQDRQLSVDLVRLANEGLHRVTVVRRTYYASAVGDENASGDDVSAGSAASPPDGPFYNIPTIRGRLLDGASFTPVTNVSITLLHEDDVVEMFDPRWTNPYDIPQQAPGTFLFWPTPIPAQRAGTAIEISYELRVEDDRYGRFNHCFSVPVTSDSSRVPVFRLERDFVLPDLYLFAR